MSTWRDQDVALAAAGRVGIGACVDVGDIAAAVWLRLLRRPA